MKRNKLFILLSLASISSVATLPLVAGSCNHNNDNKEKPRPVVPTPEPGKKEPGKGTGDKETPTVSPITTDENISYNTKDNVLTIKDVKEITPEYLNNIYKTKGKKLKLVNKDGSIIGGIKLVCPDATTLVAVSDARLGYNFSISEIEFPKLENVVTTLPNPLPDSLTNNLLSTLTGYKIVQNGVLIRWNDAFGDISDSTVTSIIRGAFNRTNDIRRISLPNLKYVQPYAFGLYDDNPFPYIDGKIVLNKVLVKWSNLDDGVVKDDNITEIYNGVFKDTDNLGAAIFENVTTICDKAFANSERLRTIHFPKVTTIGSHAFDTCGSLEEINLPEAVTIGANAFDNDRSLRSITLPKATYIGDYAFNWNQALTSVTLPKATYLGAGAFTNCTVLSEANFPEVTEIGAYAFSQDPLLKTVTLPKVTKIGESAFSDDPELSKITCPNVQEIGQNAFENTPKLVTKPTVKTE
ncbi:leucine-rich repeat protein [Mycoplasma sp. B6188]|uniref:leucine-rich repeat protein n=1 Tax=Mycoplasma sp. B6188 TaxID=3401673 RepID=UPI003AAE29DF